MAGRNEEKAPFYRGAARLNANATVDRKKRPKLKGDGLRKLECHAHLLNLITAPRMANVAKLLMLQGGKCFYCGNKLKLEDATIDHVVAKALGGDNTEANTVACCHSINQAFGNATPKEKLAAIINAGGRIECPSIPPKKPAPKTTESTTAKPPATKQPKLTNQKAPPEIKPSELRKPLQQAFSSAAATNGGEKAMLTTVSMEVRKLVSGFAVKKYGEKTFANLVKTLGYRVEKHWCFPPK